MPRKRVDSTRGKMREAPKKSGAAATYEDAEWPHSGGGVVGNAGRGGGGMGRGGSTFIFRMAAPIASMSAGLTPRRP